LEAQLRQEKAERERTAARVDELEEAQSKSQEAVLSARRTQVLFAR
jgi:hypothetical protein